MRATVWAGIGGTALICLLSVAGAQAQSSDAQGCAAQQPALFQAYKYRPRWEVAGVDFCVGAPAGLALKSPSSISAAGVRVYGSKHLVRLIGDDITLSGYDFSLDGGWGVVVEGANATIANSKFVVGANRYAPILAMASAGSVTVANSTIDGQNAV